jgi:hypothetical protein
MMELVLAFDTHAPPYPSAVFDRMLKNWPRLLANDVINTLKLSFDHYLEAVQELPLLTEAAYEAGFGFSRVEFLRVRAGLMAYADFCLGMADAAERLSARASTRSKCEALQRECREWVAPLLEENHVLGLAAAIADVDTQIARRVASYFLLDATSFDHTTAGEGYLPPFLRIHKWLLFCPYALKIMMPERNLLYVLNKRDRKTFDDLVYSATIWMGTARQSG